MKTTLLILLSGAFFAVVQTQNDQIIGTLGQLCLINEIPTGCKPCENFCNEDPVSCIDVCVAGDFCTCFNGYSRISRNTKLCVPNEWCYLFDERISGTTTTTTTTIEPSE